MNQTLDIQIYRRKRNRLEWHFRDDCRKFPIENFELNNPDIRVMQSMVCPICLRLQAGVEGTIDDRKPKSFMRKFF